MLDCAFGLRADLTVDGEAGPLPSSFCWIARTSDRFSAISQAPSTPLRWELRQPGQSARRSKRNMRYDVRVHVLQGLGPSVILTRDRHVDGVDSRSEGEGEGLRFRLNAVTLQELAWPRKGRSPRGR